MKYEIVELKDMIVLGKSIVTTNAKGQSVQDIGAMWQGFIGDGVMDEIANKVNGKGIGLYTDYEGDATMPYRFMCCVEVEDHANVAFEKRTIRAGKYAKFSIKGHMIHDVGKAWQSIWGMDLNRSYKDDFELYHNDSEDISNQNIDIFISLI